MWGEKFDFDFGEGELKKKKKKKKWDICVVENCGGVVDLGVEIEDEEKENNRPWVSWIINCIQFNKWCCCCFVVVEEVRVSECVGVGNSNVIGRWKMCVSPTIHVDSDSLLIFASFTAPFPPSKRYTHVDWNHFLRVKEFKDKKFCLRNINCHFLLSNNYITLSICYYLMFKL